MIQYNDRFTALTYVDASGQLVTVEQSDSVRYYALLQIMGKQQDAIGENSRTKEDYLTKLSNYQVSVDAGRPGPPLPVKPIMRVVGDDGTVTYVPFSPPLPDPKPVSIPSPAVPFTTGLDPVLQLLGMLNAQVASANAKLDLIEVKISSLTWYGAATDRRKTDHG